MDFHIRIPHEKLYLNVDRDKLEKIVLNLLSNAIKFAPENGWVQIKAEFTDQFVIAVGNNGDPIPLPEQSKIFDRFYQAGDTRHQGAGIGLALVREFVDLHGGKIEVESSAEKGTWFRVLLPLEKAASAEEINGVAPAIVSKVANLEQNQLTISPQPIAALKETQPLLLIVEDHSEVRNYIKERLDQHFIIKEAENGQEGLVQATTLLPDLIISDVMMPVMDGVTFCHKVKNDPRTDHIPLILLTAKADIESRLTGLQTGADDYLAKPFNSRELLIRIENLIRQRQKLQERYRQSLYLGSNARLGASASRRFIKNALALLEKKLSDSQFTTEEFARLMQLSRTHLHRKLKAIRGYERH